MSKGAESQKECSTHQVELMLISLTAALSRQHGEGCSQPAVLRAGRFDGLEFS